MNQRTRRWPVRFGARVPPAKSKKKPFLIYEIRKGLRIVLSLLNGKIEPSLSCFLFQSNIPFPDGYFPHHFFNDKRISFDKFFGAFFVCKNPH